MGKDIPLILYKYKPIKKQDIDNLREHKIWVPSPQSFNDPFDCNIKFSGKDQYLKSLKLYLNALGVDSSNEAAILVLLSEAKKQNLSEFETISLIESNLEKQNHATLAAQIDDYEKRLRNTANSMGVLSLSEKKDDILMWSHYADYHQGMCLGFSTNDIHENCAVNYLGDSDYTMPIVYSDYYPSLLDMKIFDATPKEMQQHMYLLKSDHWKYEAEWRMLISDNNIAFPYPGKLASVIFGAKAKDDDIQDILNVIRTYSEVPTIYFAVMREDKFSLEIVN
jgi:hypothetical protein